MNLKNLTPAETVTAITKALKAYQVFNLFKRCMFERNASKNVIIAKIEMARINFEETDKRYKFCESFIQKINELNSDSLELYEYLRILAELTRVEAPFKTVNNYLHEESWSYGERMIFAFEQKDISPALGVFRIRFWDNVDNLKQVINLYSDAQAELTENSLEWNFCGQMIERLNGWRGQMSFRAYIEIILRLTGWSKNPTNFADEYANGDERRTEAYLKLRVACAVLSAYTQG